jgi:hypothetical protein
MLSDYFDEPEQQINIPLKEYHVIHCSRKLIEKFIEKWHYSKSINGCNTDHCFALMRNSEMVGAMFYGKLAMVNQWKPYGNEEDVIELRRLCCIDDTPKNTESYFIGKTLRWLQLHTDYKVVVSYADQEHGHTGIIYKASNFKYLGLGAGAKVIVYKNKTFHDKTIRTYHNGKLKPYAVQLTLALQTGEAYYKETLGKHTYVYNLQKKRKKDDLRICL